MEKRQTSTGQPCPTALAVAQAAQEPVAPDTVILSVSRARGDYRPDSDIDLLVIRQKRPPLVASGRANRAAREYLQSHPPAVPVNSIAIPRQTFLYACRARYHVAGPALRDEVFMSGEPQNRLTSYAVRYRYRGAAYRPEDPNKATFRREITEAVHAFIGSAQELTGTDAHDLES